MFMHKIYLPFNFVFVIMKETNLFCFALLLEWMDESSGWFDWHMEAIIVARRHNADQLLIDALEIFFVFIISTVLK